MESSPGRPAYSTSASGSLSQSPTTEGEGREGAGGLLGTLVPLGSPATAETPVSSQLRVTIRKKPVCPWFGASCL